MVLQNGRRYDGGSKMTTKQALEDLRDKVKEGEYPSVDIKGDLNWTSFKWEMVTGAFEGSLDAAKALHEAVLPDWKYCIDDEWVCVYLADIFEATVGRHAEPARAWLLAILEALIEKEEK